MHESRHGSQHTPESEASSCNSAVLVRVDTMTKIADFHNYVASEPQYGKIDTRTSLLIQHLRQP